MCVTAASPIFHSASNKDVSTADKNKPGKKNKVRLNKRFQVAIVDPIVNPLANLSLRYLDALSPASPKDYLLLSIILATSLRGPPPVS